MKKLNRLLIIGTCLGLTSCYTVGFFENPREEKPKEEETPGVAYLESFNTAILSCKYTPDNHTPKEGDAYRDGQTAAEDADCHGDEDA